MPVLNVLPEPCTSCPYRRDVPSGVWHESEYEKLRQYDDPQTSFATFLCHQTDVIGKPTVCRGWLTVHAESIAARLCVGQGEVTNEQRYAPVAAPLYATGNEAADHGEAQIEKPRGKAVSVVRRLLKAKGVRR